IAYCLHDAEAAALALDGASGDAAAQAAATHGLDPRRIIIAADGRGDGIRYQTLLDSTPLDAPLGADPAAICLMLYTSGTTGRPKGVPRSHRAELAAGVSQIAHHRYGANECTLGVMPMFHTMGVRSLLASALLSGTLVCLPDYAPDEVLRLVAAERI